MKIRNSTTTVTDLSTQPSTGRECYVCEDGNFVRDEHELICDSCQYTPSFETRATTRDVWERYRRDVQQRAYGETDGRPRLVGGFHDAYWGDGRYEYEPTVGFQF